jgi:hypothetical protein
VNAGEHIDLLVFLVQQVLELSYFGFEPADAVLQ